MNHTITIAPGLGRHEHAALCSCGWLGQLWRSRSHAETEAEAHLAEVTEKEPA